MSLKTQNVSQRAPPGIYAVSICGGPPKKNSEFYLKFWPLAPHICFWVHHNGKGAPDGAKICNFQKLAWYSPENGNAWTKCLPHHFGGCFARFLESVLRFGRSKCHFLALENGHFCQKCPFWNAKKWHFERRNLRTESKNLAKHPPKWWGRHLVHAFPFLGEYQANFWKLQVLALGLFSHYES